jgi:hypothetical protein
MTESETTDLRRRGIAQLVREDMSGRGFREVASLTPVNLDALVLVFADNSVWWRAPFLAVPVAIADLDAANSMTTEDIKSLVAIRCAAAAEEYMDLQLTRRPDEAT